MRSYVKIYGPPIGEAIEALEKIALDMPTVCIMDKFIERSLPIFGDQEGIQITDYHGTVGTTDYAEGFGIADWTARYFGPETISRERCDTIISKSGEALGEYDFYFEWFTEPKMEQIKELIKKIDEALAPLGCHYTIMTK